MEKGLRTVNQDDLFTAPRQQEIVDKCQVVQSLTVISSQAVCLHRQASSKDS